MQANLRLLGLSAALAGLAAGCGYQPIGTFERPEYIVQAAQGQYDLRFVPGSAQLAPGEGARLSQFLQGMALRGDDDVLLTLGPASPMLNGARLEVASQAVAEAGTPAEIHVVNTRSASRLVAAPDVIRVEALHGGQLLVACPSPYLDPYEEEFALRLPDMQCSNQANLAYMAANPGDLVNPRALGPAEGTTSAAAVLRHRTDQVKQPEPLTSLVAE